MWLTAISNATVSLHYLQGCGSRSGAGSGSGLFSVEAEARKSYRFRFHIGYLTLRVTCRKSFVHFPMWIER